MAANNSSGARSIRYGLTVDNVRSIDAILADGSAHHFGWVPGNLDGGDGSPGYVEMVQKLRDLAIFSRQFATLLRSGLTVSRGLETMARQTVVVAIASVGMTLVIVQGGIDLSVGSMVALAFGWTVVSLAVASNALMAIGTLFGERLAYLATVGGALALPWRYRRRSCHGRSFRRRADRGRRRSASVVFTRSDAPAHGPWCRKTGR